jgi:hypothetical protein
MDDLSEMIKEQKQCFLNPDQYKFQCAEKVLEKYIRKNNLIKKLIYPWRNFDWDYSIIVEKNYNPIKHGASSKGTATALVNDISLLVKIIEGFIITANPNNQSGASDSSKKNNDLVPCNVSLNNINNLNKKINTLQNIINKESNPLSKTIFRQILFELIGKSQSIIKSCAKLNSLKEEELNQKKPYNSIFFDKKLDGENSSSYYALTGVCPSKISNKVDCENKGYTWMGNPLFKSKNKGVDTKNGSCFRGKYLYIDNKPGLSIGETKSFKGLIPSLMQNLSELSPDKLAFAANGFGIPGLDIQQCGHESFVNYKSSNILFKTIDILICIILMILIIVFLNI